MRNRVKGFGEIKKDSWEGKVTRQRRIDISEETKKKIFGAVMGAKARLRIR